MDKNNAKIMREADRFLKRTKEYKARREEGCVENYTIEIVLKKSNVVKNNNLPKVVVAAACEDMELTLHPCEGSVFSNVVPYSLDDDFLRALERGYEIVNISMWGHHFIWHELSTQEVEPTSHPKGMQMYLGYCKRNGITIEKLRASCEYEGADIMPLYDGKTKPTPSDRKHCGDVCR